MGPHGEIREEVVALVQRVVPEEIDNVDELMSEFKGREGELLGTLLVMEERQIALQKKGKKGTGATGEDVEDPASTPEVHPAAKSQEIKSSTKMKPLKQTQETNPPTEGKGAKSSKQTFGEPQDLKTLKKNPVPPKQVQSTKPTAHKEAPEDGLEVQAKKIKMTISRSEKMQGNQDKKTQVKSTKELKETKKTLLLPAGRPKGSQTAGCLQCVLM